MKSKQILTGLALLAAAALSFTAAPGLQARDRQSNNSPGTDDPIMHDADNENEVEAEPNNVNDDNDRATPSPTVSAAATATPEDNRGRHRRGRGRH